jgi:hypothetical protein
MSGVVSGQNFLSEDEEVPNSETEVSNQLLREDTKLWLGAIEDRLRISRGQVNKNAGTVIRNRRYTLNRHHLALLIKFPVDLPLPYKLHSVHTK